MYDSLIGCDQRPWTSDGFRVWMREAVSAPWAPAYCECVWCRRLSSEMVVLRGYLPGAWELTTIAPPVMELHYDKCGQPSRYVAERCKFRLFDCQPEDWWIEPLEAQIPEGREAVVLNVAYRFRQAYPILARAA